MTLQTGVLRNRPGLEGVTREFALPYGLRNSCDLCYASKLRCSRDRPICARCRKQGADCNYSPTKRPGRRRKVTNVSISDDHTQKASHSSNRKIVCTGINEMRSDEGEASAASHETARSNPNYLVLDSGPVMDDDDFEHFFGDIMSSEPAGLLDIDLSEVGSHPTNEGRWITYESMGEEFNHSGHSANQYPSPQDLDQSKLSKDSSWLPNSAQFLMDCLSLKHWTFSSRSLQLMGNASRQNMDDEQCCCHSAMANLQFHRKSAFNIRAMASLEICLHLQRLLDWTRGVQKGCQSCQDDELVKFVIASVADEVVGMYRAIVEESTKDMQRGATNAGIHQHSVTTVQNQQPVFDETTLHFGSKTIQGPGKAAFLRRMISLKLQRISVILEDLLDRSNIQNKKKVGQPLRLLISESLEHLNITTGILSMQDS